MLVQVQTVKLLGVNRELHQSCWKRCEALVNTLHLKLPGELHCEDNVPVVQPPVTNISKSLATLA